MTDYRTKCLENKGNECVECGSTEEIEVHHVDGNRWNNELSNLVPLCHDCHESLHASEPEMRDWTEKLNKEHYNGPVSEKEIDDAFENVEFESPTHDEL